MTETQTEPKSANGENALTVQARVIEVRDDSEFQNLLDTGRFAQLKRVAQMFAASQLVPEHYQRKPENCFIGLQMALRMGVDPFMFFQNSYLVHGRPGMEAKLAIALVNSSGIFTDSLDYEIEGGDDARAKTYRVRAYAIRKSTNKQVKGPWVDWEMVRGERWDQKDGSKWKTMPALMFQYRAAMFFARLHCPERLMGMQTVEELHDMGGDGVVPPVTERGVKGLATKIANRERQPSEGQRVENEDGTVIEGEQPVQSEAAPNANEPMPNTEPEPKLNRSEIEAAAATDEPPVPAPISPREQFLIQYREACEAAGLTDELDRTARLARWALKAGVKGKEEKASDEQRKILFSAIASRSGYWA